MVPENIAARFRQDVSARERGSKPYEGIGKLYDYDGRR